MTEDTAPAPKAWERLESDTKYSFAAFTIYRDMGAERSTYKVAHKVGKGSALIQRWSRQHNWVQRTDDYDAYLDGQYRKIGEERHIQDLRDFAELMSENAKRTREAQSAALAKALARLNKNYDDAPGTIASLLRASAALGELALNQQAAALGVDELLRRLPE